MKRQLFDKLLLFFLCLVFSFRVFPSTLVMVIVVLTALSYGCAGCFLKPFLYRILGVLYLLLVLICPSFALLLPVLVYDFYSLRDRILLVGLILLLFLLPRWFSPSLILCLLFLMGLSLWMSDTTGRLLDSYRSLIRLRDNSVENKLLLEQKNRAIIENQNSQIYTATLKERNRIAREIHDNVGHLLTRSILQTAALTAMNQQDALNPPLHQLSDTLNQAMNNIRNSVHDLHDESIDLKTAVFDLTKSVRNFQISVDYTIENHVPRDIKYCFLAILKEALNNAVKHSNGSEIRLILREHPAFYQLLITDNGTDIRKDYHDGIGLINMRDRVQSLNGTLQIKTDHGFSIFISIMKEETTS